MARPFTKVRHPITGQRVIRCGKHWWVKIRQGGNCHVCEKQAQERARKVQKNIHPR